MKFFALIILLALSTSCSTLKSMVGLGGNDAPKEATKGVEVRADGKIANVPEAETDLELKLAKLWAKVDELEDLVSKQKQRISVLERGLMLGILPDELKNDADRSAKKHITFEHPIEPQEDVAKAKPAPEVVAPVVAPVAATPKVDKKKALADAQQYFEQGQYGRALAIYSSFDDNEADSSHRYWVGMCWYKLKEYETSYKEFSDFLVKNPTGPWAPRAKYNLAQIDYELGYKQKALDQMKKIINDYPNEDAAQMARASIQQMETNL